MSWFGGLFRRKPSAVSSLANEVKELRARFDLVQTTTDNQNHWVYSDGLSARASMSSAVRNTARKRSRYEAANNSWYAGILRTAANHIVGCGPKLQVLTDDPLLNHRLEKAWVKWQKSVGLADKLRVMVETYWRDGEVFVMRTQRPRLYPITLDLRLYEGDQVSSPFYDQSTFDPYVDDGIRFDPEANEVEFWIYDNHPGDVNFTPTLKGQWYPAREVLHLFRPDRPGQVRGMPRATPGLPLLAVMRRGEMATVCSFEAVANVSLYMKTTASSVTPAESENSPFSTTQTARNSMMMLPEGWDLFQPKMENPNSNLEMFIRQMLMNFCRCMNVPFGLGAGTSKDSNFSSFKGDIRNTWLPEVITEQDRLELTIVEPIWKWFLEDAVLVNGLLDGAPMLDNIEHKWHWDPLPALDETDAATAAKTRLQSGQTTLLQEYGARGEDFDSEMERGAAAMGVSTETLKQAIFNLTYSTPAANIPAQATPTPAAVGATAEYATIGQRAFNNNQSRIKSILTQVASGEISRTLAEVTLQSIGLDQARIDILLNDASDGQLDDPSLTEVAQ